MESVRLKETNHTFKKTMKWIGIILTGIWGIVWLGGDKITSGTLLVIVTIVMILPISQNKTLHWLRIGFICIVFCLVIWNITTTELPGDHFFRPTPFFRPDPSAANPSEITEEGYSTGIRFFDQVIHIFKGFLEGRVFIHLQRILQK